MDDSEITNEKGRAGASLGFGYEYNKKHLLLHTGIGLSYYTSRMTAGDTLQILSMVNSVGDDYKGHFLFENTNEIQKSLSIEVPLMIGYKSYKRFYCLVGTKILFSFTGNSITESDVTTSAYYDYIIGNDDDGILTDMLNHGLYTETRTKKTDINLKMIFASSLEFGWDLSKPYPHKKNDDRSWRIAFFIDYGYAPFNDTKTENLIVNNSNTEEYTPTINNLLYYGNESNTITTLYTGIKITLLIKEIKLFDCNCHK